MAELADDVRRLFETRNFGHVASLMPDGSPHSVPVWIGLEGEQIVFFTHSRSRKARNLDRDPWVATSVVDDENPYSSAHVRGRVVERTGEEALTVMDRICDRYTGAPFPVRGPHGVLFVVEPEHVSSVELPFTYERAG